MKISKLFHWLYASVMFLPLLIIPLFGIWTINHDHNEPITIDVKQNLVVDFNQLVKNGNFEDNSNWSTYNCTCYWTDNLCYLNPTSNNAFIYQSIALESNHQYYVHISSRGNVANESFFYSFTNGGIGYHYFNTYIDFYEYEEIVTSNNTTSAQFRIGQYSGNSNNGVVIRSINLFDLSQMFGVGNEPTITQFKSLYPNLFYDYTLTSKELIKDVSVATYSETDIGSQFLYTLYNSTDKYLNFDEVLNLGAISDWINQNVFNGNAPLVFYIVWHYLDYWLILSIFWLCFDVLIYVPNIAHRWLDKASLE